MATTPVTTPTTVQHDLAPFVRGDSYTIPVSFMRQETPEDLTDWKLWFTVKLHPEQDDSEAAIQKILTVIGNSVIIELVSEDTKNLYAVTYYYDVQIVSPAGDVIKTVVQGKLKLLAGVTGNTQP